MPRGRKPANVSEVKKGLIAPVEKEEEQVPVRKTVSTGSTLLDLAISGTRKRGGGIPGGILVEIFGPSGWGKTTLLGEICASTQAQGGFAMVGDAERRMTPEFIKYMGIQITENNIAYPSTVKDVESLIFDTPETGKGVIDTTGVDSIASLLSDLEEEKGQDKRGSSRAKDFHGMCRRAKAEISKKSRLVVFTNQIQDVQDAMPFATKERTPGGNAVPFYSSLRLRIGPSGSGSKITKEIKVGSNSIKKVLGVRSSVFVYKSSIDSPYRETDVCIMFDYGVDDIRSNLEYIKKMTGNKMYWSVDEEFVGIEDAIQNVEQGNFQTQLKETVIDLWEDVESRFKFDRVPKKRE